MMTSRLVSLFIRDLKSRNCSIFYYFPFLDRDLTCYSRRKLAVDSAALGIHSTDLQRAKIVERSNFLRRKIEAWTDVQHLYLPAVAGMRLQTNNQGGGSLSVSDIELHLPSNLPWTMACDPRLVDAEWELRYAMAEVTLNSLRSHLLLRSRLYKSKDRHVRGQAQNTRSYDLIHTVEARVKASAVKYRIIRIAMIRLTERRATDSEWEVIYKELRDTDIQGLSSLDDDGAEGHKALSWIWKIYGTGGTGVDGGTQDGV